MKVLVVFLLANFVIGLSSASKTVALRRVPLVGLTVVTAALLSRYRWV